MNLLLWILQVLTALLYGASGVMKVFMFDRITERVSRVPPIIMSGLLGLVMAFIAYGRLVLKPIV